MIDAVTQRTLDVFVFGVAGPAHEPLLGTITVSDTATAAAPGTRFAPQPSPNSCSGSIV